ncbi:hypothetical protein E2562_024457 [Oryza meyeriana var. granulata]|uniref:Uncharacterized protein n=1 Tax=Oryza meyeriana var. granulata TaxID=110450 RepID=A0A6G1EYV8_9ORYZ|nr:hypothetical protein E2562_024457 [Oryza meyeriana var. granulata]
MMLTKAQSHICFISFEPVPQLVFSGSGDGGGGALVPPTRSRLAGTRSAADYRSAIPHRTAGASRAPWWSEGRSLSVLACPRWGASRAPPHAGTQPPSGRRALIVKQFWSKLVIHPC